MVRLLLKYWLRMWRVTAFACMQFHDCQDCCDKLVTCDSDVALKRPALINLQGPRRKLHIVTMAYLYIFPTILQVSKL